MKVQHTLCKSIGFIDYHAHYFEELISNGFEIYQFSDETIQFLEKSYLREFLNLNFKSKDGFKNVLTREINHTITLKEFEHQITINSISIYVFHGEYDKLDTAIFSVDYSPLENDIVAISEITSALRLQSCLVEFESQTLTYLEYISSKILKLNQLYDNDSALAGYSGLKFKSYLILDFENYNSAKADELLYEIGTGTKVGLVAQREKHGPSEMLINDVLRNKISAFNNYACLPLLDSFTAIGSENYSSENVYTQSTWSDIYFSLYIFNLYVKSSLQILINDFKIKPLEKRKHFQDFYNRYYFKKISYNFLPNLIFSGISNGLEIEDDLSYLENKINSLATKINERQQNQQEFLLLIISALALLETPLHLDGIKDIIGIKNATIYNSSVYAILVLTVGVSLIKNYKRK